MKSTNISRLPGVASEGTRTAFVLLVVPNSVPKDEGLDSWLILGFLTSHRGAERIEKTATSQELAA
jgi:hypothetical protein